MKAKILILPFAALLIAWGCAPVEDHSLRDDFNNAGTPISQAALDAALSVTQPYPNLDDVVEGDQYVVLKNERPDIGGVWHLGWSTGVRIVNTDNKTIIYDANGEYDIYFTGVSANQTVTSRTFHITVTNCFDEYDQILSGAVDKADITAKKTWTFLPVTGALYNGMYGNWKYYEMSPGLNSWGTLDQTTLAEQSVTFEFADHVMTINRADGSVSQTGSWAYTHNTPEGVVGELYTTVAIMGTNLAWSTWNGTATPYWILSISEDELIICFPQLYDKPAAADDWDYYAMYYFLVPAE